MNHEYTVRIQTVLDFIEDNLERELNLDMLAEAANFSKFHFSKVFAAITGQTPITYLTERRLDRAVTFLNTTHKTILEISSLCGFQSISSFNASFRRQYQTTPGAMRKSMQELRNYPVILRNNKEDMPLTTNYDRKVSTNHDFLRRVWDMNIEVKELADYSVAYVRHVGSYLETYKAWGALSKWVETNHPGTGYYIGISLDDPGVTDEFSCRYDACITIPQGFIAEADPDVQFKTLPGGQYALYRFYDAIDKLAIAYQSVYGQWLPGSSYEPDDKHALEFCMNDPYSDPEGKAKVDLYIPVKRIAGQ